MKTYILDTSSLLEIIYGNDTFNHFVENVGLMITKTTLVELHYWLLRIHGEQVAEQYYEEFVQYVVPLTNEVIRRANEIRFQLKIKKPTHTDCINYATALENGCTLVTAQTAFAGYANVITTK